MDKVREGLMRRYTDALEVIGYLPKDSIQQAAETGSDTLSAMHLAYISEINKRRAVQQPVGRPSQDAIELAENVGMNPAKYDTTGSTIPETDRDEILAEA